MEGVAQQHTRSHRADGAATQSRGGQQGRGSTASVDSAVPVSPRARARSPSQPFFTDEPLPTLTVPLGAAGCIFSGSTASSGVFRISDPCSEGQATLRSAAAAAPSSSRPASGNAPAPRGRTSQFSEARGLHEGCIARTVKRVVEGLRRCVPDCLSRRCQALSLPRAVADVRHLMDALYYEEIGFLILRSCLCVVHTGVFLYSCATEKPFEGHAYVALLLGLVSVLTLVRVFCQYQIVKALARLRWMWWQRAVLPDFVKLLCSPLWQLQRFLFLVSFSLYFVALHLAYHRGTIVHLDSADAPILMRYISLVVLVFLSVLGPHILMVALVCTCLIVCCCTPAEDLEQLLVEEPRGAGRALPARLLQLMKEERWVPPEESSRRGSYSDKCSSASGGRRGSSDTTHGVDEKKQHALQRGNFSEQSTGLAVNDCTPSRSRSKRGKGTCEACDTHGEVDAEPRKDFMCAICLTDFHEGDVIRRLPCRHVFHSACITRWLSNHATCPLRCYVNFSVDVVGPPFYDARRCLQTLRSQLSRRARARCFPVSRLRRSRHAGQRRSSARLQRADQTHRQAQQEADQHPPEPGEDGYEEGNLDHFVKTEGDLSLDHPATADACADSAAAENQTLAEELVETVTCAPVISEEEKEGHYSFSIRQTDAAAPGEEVLQPSRELEDGGVKAAEVHGTSEAGWSSAVSSWSAAHEGIHNEDDNDMYLARVSLANSFQEEKGGKIQAVEERGTGRAQQQGSAVSSSRAAPGGALPAASIESVVCGPRALGDG